jgi:ornithine cyclodeaminase/alanine dehydrogenase-like protein (mu-crystallin family)
VLGVHVAEGGFHVKAAALNVWGRLLFAAKINANFPGNPGRHGLPTIQGMLGLFDAERGAPLALMDSMSLTTIRTAAATAVAARHLARRPSATLAIIGCGAQARPHVVAISAVRPITDVVAFDTNAGAMKSFIAAELGASSRRVSGAATLEAACAGADIIVTSTPSRAAFLFAEHVRPGTFVGAVGADNEHKHEVDPGLMQGAGVVVDDLDQCATIGDLHHALDAGVMRRPDVRATLGEVIIDPARGRQRDDEIIVFDSTGVAIEDVAAAALVLERAEAAGAGTVTSLGA